jgi:DNA-binding winged helix-turn-helix (wHTH) protein
MLLKTEGLYVFGPYRLDARERQLLRDGVPVPLPPKAFDLLVALVAQAGHLRMKGELLREVWPDTFVEEANLSYTISQLRTALGDNGELHQLIETVPRRGYRFIGPVLLPTVPEAATEELQNRAATARPALAYWMLGVVGVLVLAASLAWLVARPLPPQVTGYAQLTRSRVLFPPYPSARLERRTERVLRQLDTGREVLRVPGDPRGPDSYLGTSRPLRSAVESALGTGAAHEGPDTIHPAGTGAGRKDYRPRLAASRRGCTP